MSNLNIKKGFLHRDIFLQYYAMPRKMKGTRFLSHRNLSIDLHLKSIGWFCCGRNIKGHNLWLNKKILNQLTKLPNWLIWIFFFFFFFFFFRAFLTIAMILSLVCVSFRLSISLLISYPDQQYFQVIIFP